MVIIVYDVLGGGVRFHDDAMDNSSKDHDGVVHDVIDDSVPFNRL